MMRARRALLVCGSIALLVSLFAPAAMVSKPHSGIELLLRGIGPAVDALVSGDALRLRCLGALTLLAMTSNVVLPALACWPGGWRWRLAAALYVNCVGLTFYLWVASPIQFLPGALVWLGALLAFVLSHRA